MRLTFPRSFRFIFLTSALISFAMVIYAIYAEYGQMFEPCPLCIFQRVALALVGVVALVGGCHNPTSRLTRGVYGVGGGLVGLLGTGIAARHVWLQNLPADQVPACGPGLEYMLQALPSYLDVAKQVLRGSGECAEVNWTLFGLSMPVWTLMAFVGLAGALVWAGFGSEKR